MHAMNRKYILYNPKSGNGAGKADAEILEIFYGNTVYVDITQVKSTVEFLQTLDESDEVVLCGGDGTISRFANDTRAFSVPNPIYYFATGTGNDFVRDLDLPANADPNFRINDYLRGLPSVSVHGQTYLFLNNVGFGIDGYCCEEGDRLRETYRQNNKKKEINYILIAIKGLLFRFKPRNAVITVDGVSHRFKDVWLAPTMHGRYYGSGMMAAPKQDRLDPDRSLSIMVMHGAGRLKTLCMFPSIFKGKHIRYKKYVTVLTGHEIAVEFDQPTPLQIDGETVLGVRSYQAKSSLCALAAKSAVGGETDAAWQ